MQTTAPQFPELPAVPPCPSGRPRLLRRCLECGRPLRRKHPSVFCSIYCLNKFEAATTRDETRAGDERKQALSFVPKQWVFGVGMVCRNCGYMRVPTKA